MQSRVVKERWNGSHGGMVTMEQMYIAVVFRRSKGHFPKFCIHKCFGGMVNMLPYNISQLQCSQKLVML